MPDVDKLRQLAAWYREFAERAGNPWIWEARLRTAETLEAEASRAEASFALLRSDAGAEWDDGTMKSAEELRTEARHLIATARNLSDPQLRKELAARSLALANRAEAIANSIEDPEIIRKNIARYHSMLAAGISCESHKQIVEEMLADAKTLLAEHLLKKAP